MRYIFFTIVLLCMCAPVMGALSMTFQTPGDYESNIVCGANYGGTCNIMQNTNGGNSYYRISSGYNYYNSPYAGIRNAVATPMSYGAFTGTMVAGSVNSMPAFFLYGSTGVQIGAYGFWPAPSGTHRYEMVVSGSSVSYYQDGAWQATNIVTQYPSYVLAGVTAYSNAGGSIDIDDVIMGNDANQDIFGAPMRNNFILLKDSGNPSNHGFAYNNGSIISSYNMTTTWAVGGGMGNNASHIINLNNFNTGETVGTYTTTAGSKAGTIIWALEPQVFNNANAKGGWYTTTTAGSTEYADTIPYIGYGATIAFDSREYTVGNMATITYSVTGSYWDPTTYDYSIAIQNVYGVEVDSQTIVLSSGTAFYTFTDTDIPGVYYAIIKATPKAGGTAIIMNYDYTQVTGYIAFRGNVYDASTALALSGVSYNFTQGSIISAGLSGYDGNFSVTGFGTGNLLTYTFNKTGYRTRSFSLTPQTTGTKTLNMALYPSSPSVSNVTIGGVIHDSVYGNIIPSATVTATNGTTFSTVANVRGGYTIPGLTAGKCYAMGATKTGFLFASPMEPQCVVSA